MNKYTVVHPDSVFSDLKKKRGLTSHDRGTLNVFASEKLVSEGYILNWARVRVMCDSNYMTV